MVDDGLALCMGNLLRWLGCRGRIPPACVELSPNMALTGKQKRVLRGSGQLLEPVVFVGKEGVDAAIHPTEDAFRTHELIKVRVLRNAPDSTTNIAPELAQRTNSELAGKVGHTFMLYRPNPELKKRIDLPPAKEQ